MKNNILFLTGLIAVLFSYTTASAMSYNMGIQIGYNIEVSTIKYRNDGSLQAFNAANINVTTFSGFGSVSAPSANIRCNNYNFTGSVSCTQECVINTKKFEAATGSIASKKIIIICDEFNFQGDISCEQECRIYVKNKFDYNMFKRNGLGKFTIIITKNNYEQYTQENLLSSTSTKFIQNCLNLTADNIENELKKTRTHAVLNGIDDIKILEGLKKNVEEKAYYCKERLNQEHGESASLYTSTLFGIVGSIGMATSTAAFLYNKPLAQRLRINDQFAVKLSAAAAGLLSLGSLFLSFTNLSEWLNPQYNQKYEKLSLVITKIDESLKTERAPEEEIVILQ